MYFLVFLVEIWPEISLFTCARWCQRKKPEDHEIVDFDADVQMDDNPIFDPDVIRKAGTKQLKNELDKSKMTVEELAAQNKQFRRELRQEK